METTRTIRIVVDASRAVDGSAQATRALQQLERQTANMDSTMARVEKSLASIGTTVKANLILALTDVGHRLLDMAKQSLEAAAGLDELAEQMGITARGLQGLQFAAVQNGLKLEELQTGVAKFSQKIGEAAAGSKPMIDALNDIGVKILDTSGKLRPTERLMQEVASAILAIEDPAKRTAATVDFFGKAGAKMTPVLREMADGFALMGAKAQDAGAMISKEAIEKLDKLADAGERNKLVFRALFAENAAGPLTAVLELINSKMANLSALAKSVRTDITALLAFASNPMAAITTALTSKTPGEAAADNAAKAQREIEADNETLGRLGANDVRRRAVTERIARNQKVLQAAQVGMVAGPAGPASSADPDNIGATVSLIGGGAKNPISTEDKKAGESLAQRIAKEIDSLKAARAAQDEMTEAARRGDVAFIEQESHAAALAKAIDIYGGKLSSASPEVKKLTADIEAQIKATKEAKAAENFVVATTELEKQNQLLELQLKLMNEAPEVQAREIALLKSKLEAQKGGQALTAQDVENRRTAIEQNERLKNQAEELKRAQELWTEPLKQALRDIQSTAAGAFDRMLESGNISFQSLGDAFKATIRRMAAEFLALATVRPVMSVLVQGLSGLGVMSPGMASSLGFPSGGGYLPQMPGGGSVSLPGGGMGFGGAGSSFGFLNYQPFASATPAGGFESIDALLSSGQVAGTGLNSLSLGSILGGVGSIGMGAFSLLSGKGSTGSTIGGISGILGGGLSLAASAGLIGSAFGPIGMGIGLIGGLLGGLLGGGGGGEPPLAPLNYSSGFFRFDQQGKVFTGDAGVMNGGSSFAGQAGAWGKSVLDLIALTGSTPVAGKLWGGTVGQGIGDPRNGSMPMYNLDIHDPNGNGVRLATGLASPMQNVVEMVVSQAFKASVLNGGVKDASPNLITALKTKDPTILKDTQELVEFVKSYDKLGKAANSVKDAIDALNIKMAQATTKAQEYGLSLEPITAELEKQTKRTAQDFIDSMLDPMAVQMRALEDEREAAMASAEYIRDHITSVYVDMDKIATYYTNKEAALRDQFYQGGVTNLQNLIKRLTFGDLANASPDTSLAGTRATYMATLAQARAGDASAIASLPGIAESYAGTARSYFASSPEYAALVASIRQSLEEVVAVATGGSSSSAGSPAAIGQASQALIAANDQLREIVSEQSKQVSELREMVSALTLRLGNLATNRQ